MTGSLQAVKVRDFPDIEHHDRYLRKTMLVIAIIVSGFVSLWYLTTFVYRAPFPEEQLNRWKKSPISKGDLNISLDVPVSFHLHTSVESQALGRQLMAALQIAHFEAPRSNGLIKTEPVFYLHTLEPNRFEINPAVNFTSEGQFGLHELLGINDGVLEYHLIVVPREDQELKMYVRELHSRPVFYVLYPPNETAEAVEALVKDTVSKILSFLVEESPEGLVVNYSPSYQLTFTVMYETPPSMISPALDLKLPKLIGEHISPLLNLLAPLSRFEVTSQTQYYSKLTFTPQKVAGYEGLPTWYAVEQRQLPHFINNAEWDLASAVSTSPDLNLIIYVPSSRHSPLHIVDNKHRRVASNAFAIPQWGGVTIVNPSHGQVAAQEVTQALAVHLLHLQGLLGLVPAPFESPGELRLSLDRLFLQKAATLAASATSTLSALQALIVTIPQMEVGDVIIAHTKACLNAISDASEALSHGHVMDALFSAREAFQHAEFGFFHPTMVSQMYFPTDAAYALFLPLLLPSLLPLVLGFIKSRRRSMANR
ncbi:GPI transamidase component [Massospora cicadina]|nr:GPI transamidase component [Massospora cicadina]